ncbi:class I SAM-dependent methyltransferase [Nocardia sp. NPDC101769]|uniref:class I SAM-dependent methyltransferase n=1 Tax=Nocardia sp. NPDC101769 TaxID=3364333 RepID=UPI00382420EB
MSEPRISVDLDGVPETLLWPLYCRTEESCRPDALLSDPKAEQVRRMLDYPFDRNFGRPHPVFGLRALCFDAEIRRYVATHPNATIVALGEGLETQFWRVDNGRLRWLSVDLPETVQLRRRLLPDEDRRRSVSCSALDPAWMDEVDASDGLFITALGLFMYLPGEQVLETIVRCAARFPGAKLMFDAMPKWLTSDGPEGTWLSTLLMRGRDADNYRLPPMVWGIGLDELRDRLQRDRNIAEVADIKLPAGRGPVFGYLNPIFGSVPGVRNLRPSQVLVTFSAES